MEDLFDFLKFFFCILLGVLALFGVFYTAAYAISSYDCSVYAKNTGRKTNFEFGTCYVNLAGDRYIPQSELNYRAITNEVK